MQQTALELRAQSIGREQLEVPELSLTDDASQLPKMMFHFFEELWRNLEYEPIKTPHHDGFIIAATTDYVPDLLIGNSYVGLTNGNVLDRRPHLQLYKQYAERLKQLSTGSNDEPAAKALRARLAKIRRHIPDCNGTQGVQTYSMAFARRRHQAIDSRQTAGRANLIVSKTFTLENEAIMYGLPNQGHDTTPKPYPYIANDLYSLLIERQPYSTSQAEIDHPYTEEWRRLVHGIVAALDGSLKP